MPHKKRQKPLPPLPAPLSPLHLANLPAIQRAYSHSTPYNHGVIADLFEPGHLEKVLDEIKQHV